MSMGVNMEIVEMWDISHFAVHSPYPANPTHKTYPLHGFALMAVFRLLAPPPHTRKHCA